MKSDLRWTSGIVTVLLLPGLCQAASTGGIIVDVAPVRQSLTRSDDVVVTVTIRNTSNTTRYLLKWQTPLAGVQAPLFDVTRDGLPVSYLGIQAKRPAPTPADFIALAPGMARSSRVELSALYRMDITGAYSVRYRADRLQVYGRPDASRPPGAPAVTPLVAAVWIDGLMPRGMPESAYTPVAALTFSHCSNAQQAGITAAAARQVEAIRDAFATRPLTVDCACTRSWTTYVYPDQPHTIYVCKAFWTVGNAAPHEYFGENDPYRDLRPAR
jgi:peptidyl-Lys metalloendopeptidase